MYYNEKLSESMIYRMGVIVVRKITNLTQDVISLALGSSVKTIDASGFVYITGAQHRDNLTDLNKMAAKNLINIGSWEYDEEHFDSVEDVFPHGTTANRPSSPPTGYVFFDETLVKDIVYTGVVWANVDGSAL